MSHTHKTGTVLMYQWASSANKIISGIFLTSFLQTICKIFRLQNFGDIRYICMLKPKLCLCAFIGLHWHQISLLLECRLESIVIDPQRRATKCYTGTYCICQCKLWFLHHMHVIWLTGTSLGLLLSIFQLFVKGLHLLIILWKHIFIPRLTCRQLLL